VGGIAVFANKNVEEIEGTIRNSRGGHFTVGAYTLEGQKVVLGAIYGPSASSDLNSLGTFSDFIEQIRELGHRIGSRDFIIAGDFMTQGQSMERRPPGGGLGGLKADWIIC